MGQRTANEEYIYIEKLKEINKKSLPRKNVTNLVIKRVKMSNNFFVF